MDGSWLILVSGAAAAILLFAIGRWSNGSDKKMLAQYAVLESRFRFERKAFRNAWGGEFHHRLSGEYRGYPVSVYDHFLGKGREKRVWTSMTMEALFAGEAELVLELDPGDEAARFANEAVGLEPRVPAEGAFRFRCNEPGLAADWPERLSERLAALIAGAAGNGGALRLSKGFFEYRESGVMDDEARRLRFQNAMLVMAELADFVSILKAK